MLVIRHNNNSAVATKIILLFVSSFHSVKLERISELQPLLCEINTSE